MQRREFIQQSLAATAPLTLPERTARDWKRGMVAHLLPAVSHERILRKASFDEALRGAPILHAGSRRVRGQQTDTRGNFWLFDAARLEPARPYALTITNHAGKTLCDSWTLKTFPAPNDQPQRLRLLIYTCAGGHDVLRTRQDKPGFLPMEIRGRLLERGLSFQPDALIAIGDHVYWDLRTGAAASSFGASKNAEAYAGKFNRTLPVFGSPNEEVLKRAAGPQIAPLYGTRCRSTPVFFVQDDHDYFENDEANDRFVSFPPDHFMLNLARATQRLYYPEFLPDENRPPGLPASSALDLPPGLSESFGTLRYGRLLEAMIYDCRRFLTLAGPSATFVPPTVEAWMLARMNAPGIKHVVNIPSTPFGWSAGKWGEWYADILEEKGKLTIAKPKPYWQQGWRAQHDRLLTAA
ncbi:MAG: hypothetical protein ACKV2V_07275, partial [Blastocatellia bacterium]